MNGLPYYKRYPRDFIEGTIGMPFELKGAYGLLLDLIYMQGGRLPDDPRYISGLLGCSVRAWKGYREQLLDLGKVTAVDGVICNFRADKELETSRSQQDKQRENRSRPNKNNDLPSPKPNHTDTDTDTEEEKKEEKKEEPDGSSKKAARGSRLPDDWRLPKAWGEWAVAEGLSAEVVRREGEKFGDYWRGLSGQRAVKSDWLATWRNWIRRRLEEVKKRSGDDGNDFWTGPRLN